MDEQQPFPLFRNVNQMASLSGLPAKWLKDEAESGLIPCIRVGKSLRFDPDQTMQALRELAQQNRREPPDPPQPNWHYTHFGRKRSLEARVRFQTLVHLWEVGDVTGAQEEVEALRQIGVDVRACRMSDFNTIDPNSYSLKPFEGAPNHEQ